MSISLSITDQLPSAPVVRFTWVVDGIVKNVKFKPFFPNPDGDFINPLKLVFI